jgi:hypothetical protein
MSARRAGGYKSVLGRLLASPVRAAGVAAVALFLVAVSHFYDRSTGFTSLISIGDVLNESKLTALKNVPHYVYEDSVGYDGAYYAQLALTPTLDQPELKTAIDNLPYRAKRMLFCWAAWALGLGQPAWIVQAHALLNVICWLALAWVLLRWFPLTEWNNFLRWVGVMFSHGMCMSVRDSLVDGPSLLLVALAMRWVEDGRRGAGVATLALAGLGKETSLLAVAGVAEVKWREPRTWWRPVLTAGIVAVPLLVWMAYIKWKFGPAADPGFGNFTLPLAGLAEKWGDVLANVWARPESTLKWATLATIVAVTVQWFFLVLRWRASEAWWRLGAAFAGMMIFLSTPVWEGFPGAFTRVLLPMTLAFNVLVPRGRAWVLLLLAGNLTVVAAYHEYSPPAREFYQLSGEREVMGAVRVQPAGGWYGPESDKGGSWRWSNGRSELRVHNASAGPVALAVRGRVSAHEESTLRIFAGEEMIWSGEMSEKLRRFQFGAKVPDGGVTLRFESDKPGRPRGTDPRKMAFSISNLEIVVTPAN